MTREVADSDASPEAVHGWGCTPAEETPPAIEANENKPCCFPTDLKRGWRRTALYGVLVFLMLLIFLNIALTLWIISALKLSMNGIGPLKIVHGGINIEGQTWITDKLVTSTIASRLAVPINMHSHRNFTVLVTEPDHLEHAKLMIKRDVVQCQGRNFEVRDARGGSVFSASREEVRVLADAFTVDGMGGVAVRSAVQTPLVRAPPGADLQLESLTRGLDLRAPQSIHLESRAGGIDITSHTDIKLDSVVGAIRIDAPNIIINQLKEAQTTTKPYRGRSMKVYQLCACSTGKLFLAAADAICAAYDTDVDLCR